MLDRLWETLALNTESRQNHPLGLVLEPWGSCHPEPRWQRYLTCRGALKMSPWCCSLMSTWSTFILTINYVNNSWPVALHVPITCNIWWGSPNSYPTCYPINSDCPTFKKFSCILLQNVNHNEFLASKVHRGGTNSGIVTSLPQDIHTWWSFALLSFCKAVKISDLQRVCSPSGPLTASQNVPLFVVFGSNSTRSPLPFVFRMEDFGGAALSSGLIL